MTRALHVLNYGWPHIDGYTIRSAGLVTAQADALGFDVRVAASPFGAFAKARDERFRTSAWGPEHLEQADGALRAWERPGIGLVPVTGARFRTRLRSTIDRFSPDVVHAHHPHYVGTEALRAARDAGRPFVYEVRCFNGDYDLDRRHPWARARGRRFNDLEYRLARQADAVVTISDGLAARLVDQGVERDRVHVVRNSVDTSRFRPRQEPRRDGPLHVGYATTFEAIENLDLLVETARRTRDAGAPVRYTIAGTGRDWERIRDLVAQHDLQDTVELPGFVPYVDMPDLYRSFDLFIVPRGDAAVAQDTTPLKPLEALASGLPVWSTDLPAMRELLADRDDVELFRNDPEVLAGLLKGVASDPPPIGTGDVGDRAWATEAARYRDVYAHAGASAKATR